MRTDPFGSSKPELDVDGDGMSNLAEFLAGTDPTLPGSVLRIQPDRVGDTVRFTFAARSNRTYTIQYKAPLTAPVWSKLRDVPAAATNRLEVIEDPGGGAIRYYRVATPQVP